MSTNTKLHEFITNQKTLGKTPAQIKKSLLNAGWTKANIDKALPPSPPSPLPAIPTPTSSLPSFGQLAKSTWQIFKNRWKTLVTISIIPTLISLAAILPVGLIAVISGLLGADSALADSPLLLFLFIPFILIFAIGLGIIMLWSGVALAVAVKTRDQNTSWKNCYQSAWPLIGKYFITTVLAGAIIMAGFFLFVIPGIIWLVQLSMVVFVVIYESQTRSAALKRSRFLTSGFRWGIFGRFLLFGLTTSAASAIVSLTILIPLLIFAVIISSISGGDISQLTSGIIGIFQAITNFTIQFIVPSFGVIFGALLYEALAQIKKSQNG